MENAIKKLDESMDLYKDGKIEQSMDIYKESWKLFTASLMAGMESNDETVISKILIDMEEYKKKMIILKKCNELLFSDIQTKN